MINNSQKYHRFTALVILGFILAGFFTLGDYGMGWDEVVRWNSGDLKVEYYQNLFSGESHDIEKHMAGDRYPGLFDLPLALFHAQFGGNRMIQGHILSILFGALGLIATAWLANTVFNSRAAFYATLLLAILPLYYGHAMINPKDIPFLASYTLGLASLVSISRQLISHERIPWHGFFYCGLAIGAAGASRVPGLILIAFAGSLWMAAWLWGGWKHKHPFHLLRTIGFLARGLLLTGSTAFVTVLLFFPRAQLQMFSSLPDVASKLHSSAAKLPLIYAGELMDAAEGPLTYAHGFFMISTPLWMLGLMLVGLGAIIHILIKGPNGREVHFFLQLAFLATGAFPWLYILITHPALHDGMRHMLFAIPPLIILMGVGIDFIATKVESQSQTIKWSAATLLVGCLILQTASLYRMHPYQYVSFNRLAGDRSTLPDRYETEYWCTSSRHLLEALPEVTGIGQSPVSIQNRVKIRISGALDSARPFVPNGFVLVDSFEEADYYLANTYLRSDLYAEGEVVYEIKRAGIPIGVIKKLPAKISK